MHVHMCANRFVIFYLCNLALLLHLIFFMNKKQNFLLLKDKVLLLVAHILLLSNPQSYWRQDKVVAVKFH